LLLLLVFALSLAACDRLALNAATLAVGDCFQEPQEETIEDVQRSPCNEPHTGEVILVADYPAQDTYPSEEDFRTWVENNCVGATFEDYIGTSFDDTPEVTVGYFYPKQDGWDERNDRQMICYVAPVGGEPVSTSLRKAPAAS
jgi:hypothetical protein